MEVYSIRPAGKMREDDLSLFKAVVQGSDEAIAISDPKGRIIYVNPAHETLFGRSQDEIREVGYREFFPPESLCVIEKELAPALEKGGSWAGVLDAFNAEGRRFSLKLRGYPVENKKGGTRYVFKAAPAAYEKKIVEDKALFEKIFDTQPGAVLILDNHVPPRIVRVNKSFSRIFNYYPNEVLGRTIDFLYAGESDIEHFRRKFYPLIEKGGFNNLTGVSMMRKCGSVFPVNVSAAPLENREGRKIGWIGVITDDTERKEAESALRDSESKLTLVIDGTPALIAYVDSSLRYVFVNKSYADWYKMSRGEIIGKYIKDLLPEDVFERSIPNYRRVLNGVPVSFENQTIDQKGDIKFVSARMVPHNRDGKTVGFFASIIDITERKMAEETLRAEFERFAALMDSLNAVVYVADMKTHDLLFMNAFACRLFGGRTGEKCWAAMGSDRPGPCTFCTNDKLLNADGNPAGPYVWESLNPVDNQWYQHMNQAIKWPDGRLVRLEIATNITDRKQAEEESFRLAAKQRQLKKAESLNRMAGAIAHRFNNHLSVVMGNLEIAMYHMSERDEYFRTLNRAMQAVQKAADLSGVMLTYLGQTADHRNPLDFSELCRQSLSKIRSIIPKDVEIVIDLCSPGPMIRADANQIRQILANLAVNAGESLTGGSGRIYLSVQTVSAGDIPEMYCFPVDWRPSGVYACLEVKDTGRGIPEGDMENLFDPFFTTQFAGRGLGLSVVFGIVQAYGGGITVESRPDEGSVFRVYFPMAENNLPYHPAPGEKQASFYAPKPSNPPIPSETTGTILVVEDDEMVRDVTESIVRRIGFNVLTAVDGISAVETFSGNKDAICLVLSDLSMPRMNGWETLAALRRIRSDIPVILASGYDEAHVMDGDHSEYPQAFLRKPYKYEELEKILHEILGVNKSAGQS